MIHNNLSIIVAITKNFAIGNNNNLLFYLPEDLKHFKKITTGHAIIMGRKTLESFPNQKPLPNRRNIVITNNKSFQCEGCEVAHSIEEALELVKHEKEAFIIGGGTIYKQFLPKTNQLYLTLIDKIVDADTFFPPIDFEEWEEQSSEQHFDEKNKFNYYFINFKRKK